MRKYRDSRYNFLLEFLSFWGDGTTCNELASHLNLRRETVQREVISPYKEQFGGVLQYDKSLRKIRLAEGAALKFCPSDPAAIAAIAGAEGIIGEYSGSVSPFLVLVEDVGLVSDLCVEPEIEAFRCLFAALMRRKAVQLDYLAKTGRLSFSFSPHTLVRTSFRLHFRGYCDTRDGRPGIYIDIIPDRVLRAHELGREGYVDAAADADWHKKVRVAAYLRDDIPESVLAALRQEYRVATSDHWKTRPVRAAVAPYIAEAFEARRVHGWNGPIWRAEIKTGTRSP
jgi:hypothetical protein